MALTNKERLQKAITYLDDNDWDGVFTMINPIYREALEELKPSDDIQEKVLDIFRKEGEVAAVKLHRRLTGASLRESKEYVRNFITNNLQIMNQKQTARLMVGQTVSEIAEDIKRLRDDKPINEVAANRLQANIQHHHDLDPTGKKEMENHVGVSGIKRRYLEALDRHA